MLEKMAWRRSTRGISEVRRALRISRGLERLGPDFATMGLAVAALSLVGYAVDLSLPGLGTEGGPHPFTMLCAAALALAMVLPRRLGEGYHLRSAIALAVTALLLWRALGLFYPPLTDPMELLGHLWPAPAGAGAKVPDVTATGPPALLLLGLTAMSLMDRRRSAFGLSFALGAASLITCLLVGYAQGVPSLGHTTPATIAAAALLTIAALCRQGCPTMIRLLRSQGETGLILRRQLIFSLAGLWGLAVLVLWIKPSDWLEPGPLVATAMIVAAMLGIGSTFGRLAAAEAERQRHLLRLEQLSSTDELTGLANRRTAQSFAEATFRAAQRHARPLSVVMIDIDGFKCVNDAHGHHVGDEVLADVAQLFQSILRPSSVISRWGGEEFLLILPETALAGALATAERLRQSLETSIFLPCGSAVTASLGCAEMTGETTSLTELLARADTALYKAKDGGRNRVEPAPVQEEGLGGEVPANVAEEPADTVPA
ncbi:GGDEF domain-containing protein [Pseudoroseicyclus tamaricis]|uniref:diguanylate cyclase n=1 Tax=Pseudoroseicyclus tamaricis TaxID=2705421 RepID=A0A6B2JUF3_9RHOB|nr:GGDEF domain-containing protein [Pseudoroseicyclus tamaricis]NDV01555.1 GGDEF domain-containing protein [Pseudoroseicyclus tamaricis]